MNYQNSSNSNHIGGDRNSLTKSQTSTANMEFVDSATAAKFLNVSKRTLQRLRDTGKLPYFKPVRKTLYKLQDLRDYVEEAHFPAFSNNRNEVPYA